MNTDTIAKLRITFHARRTMADRGVSIEEVVEILRRPDIVEHHDGKERHVGHGLALVIAWDAPDRPVLVTVLLRRREQWTNADARKR